jgi:hypothetical protein
MPVAHARAHGSKLASRAFASLPPVSVSDADLMNNTASSQARRAALASRASLLVVVGLALGLYARCMDFQFSGLDDKELVIDAQQAIRDGHAILAAFHTPYLRYYYRPLVTLSFLMDAQWSALNPFGYHLTNIALHGVSTALVFLLLRQLQISNGGARIGSALFAAHPALVSVVAWIPGRNDSLFTIFALAACLCLMRAGHEASAKWRIGHVCFFALALFTKETAIVLPVIFLCCLWCQGRVARSSPWPYWLLCVLGAVVARAAVLASHPGEGANHVQTLLHQLPVVVQSVGKLFLPVRLSPMATSADTPLWPGVLALCAGALIAQRLWPLKSRPLALGLVLLTLPLVPSLFVAERLALENRLYLPAVGLALIAAEVAERVPSRGRLGEAIAFVLVALCATVTWKYEAQFRDKRSFVQAARLASPSSALARVEMGGVYYEQDHNLDSAEAEYREAIALDPSEPVAHNDLGVLLMARHRWQDAADQLRQEIPSNPTFAVAYYNLGIVLRELGRPDDAAAQWQLALQHDATHINSMGELLVYFAKRHMLERVEHYKALLAKQGIDVSVTNDGEVKAVPR